MAYSNKLFEQAGIPPNYLTLASVLNLGNLGRSCSILADLGVWTTANTLESRLDSEDVRGECGGLCSLLATIGSGQLWPRNAKKSTNGGQILAIREGLGWTRQRQGKGCSPRVLRKTYYKMLTNLLSIYNKMWKQNVETGYTHTNTHTPNERMFIVSTCKNHRTPIIEDIQLPFLFALIVAYL